MYAKSKNSLLFVVFILIILLIITILIIAVYNTKQKNVEQYKISLNNVLYDEEYSFVTLNDDAILKKEWDDKFYLYESDNTKHSLGSETVLYDKSTREITIYGTAYQVFSNGDVTELKEKTKISKLDEFQFFKLNDRKYLIIGDKIVGPGISTIDYLIVSIDRAGNASVLNHSVNIKTINPLSLITGERTFDVANETLIVGEEKIDLKKINGSTNEYVQGANKNGISSNISGGGSGGSGGSGSSGGNSSLGDTSILDSLEEFLNSGNFNSSSNNSSGSNKVYKEIVNQIITLSGMVSTNTNKTSLYKNVSLRDISTSEGYLDVYYSIIDPENKYLNVFLAIQRIDEFNSNMEVIEENALKCQGEIECISLSKDVAHYRKVGLQSGSKYIIFLNYFESGKPVAQTADVVYVVTDMNSASVRIIEMIDWYEYTYNVKLYNGYEINQPKIKLTNCAGKDLSQPQDLNVDLALSALGLVGKINIDSTNKINNEAFICLELINSSGEILGYHKIKRYN